MHDKLPEALSLRDRPIPEIASTLQQVLGAELVARCIHARHTEVIAEYANGTTLPRPLRQATLRNLAEIVDKIITKNERSHDGVLPAMLEERTELGGKSIARCFLDRKSHEVVKMCDWL